ncbi:type I-D CRISPR-associated endonuclease Cas1d [Methanohalophilus sp. DAL1]|jgi:CRISPR-associated protein Cas1|uniref:type I-D CRISPR-associated endonuclease Cas1d n=1 Tax=Methanohalophilus sp. DAL1 TaxID=1864608 RepID=UPI000817BABD|nr:type I-D CRISPR-associated endonuclease Cas1d [Methanohalophilus sp. DAL1]OBZ35412.1 MAG: CRISPR-associated protein Cas1 [Methanohalophilus sp. DAL1]
MKASEGIFDDSVVYVTTQGCHVGINGGRITIFKKEEGQLASFPIGQVDTINVFGNINFTTPFVANANKHGIVLNYFSQFGKYRGSFVPERNTIAEVRRQQYALSSEQKIYIAQRIIRGKIRNSRTLLNRKGIKKVGILKDLENNTNKVFTLDELRGIEGEAAGIYFGLLNECLIDGWTFHKRSRHPPEDHINSLLSLTYTMMKNEVLSALRQYNLDPFLGILHADRHGRPALALDLQEEFRPIFCDAFTIRLVNKSILDHNDFQMDNRLKDYAFKKYLSKYDDYMKEEFIHPRFKYKVSRRKAARMQAILLRKVITGELKDYYPLEFKR